MAKYTTPEVAEQNLRQSFDPDYYSYIRWLIRYQAGMKYGGNPASLGGLDGQLPDDVDLLANFQEPGQSRRILANSALMAQKICHVEPSPDYPDKPLWKEKMTQAFNRAIWRGRPHMGPTKFEEYGEWGAECEAMFPYGDGLGAGFVQIGVRDDWLCIQHIPLTRVIWDRHRMGISRARYIAFCHYLSEEEAVAQFGTDIKRELSEGRIGSSALRTLKVVQYFDMGLGSHEPTEMWRLNGLAGKVLDVSENKYGCLPFAHMSYLQLPGWRRPVGRIGFQIADQQMRNAYERYQRMVLERGPGFDAVDTGKMNPDDQEALESGELLPVVRFEVPPLGKVGDYVQRYPAHESPQGLYKGLEMLDRNDPGNSGISDADRANVTSSPRTLGELEMTQGGADTQKQWTGRQYAMFLSRLFYKANYIGAKLHRAPTPVAVNGRMFLFNEPGVPQSNLEYWLTPQSWPVVNEDSLNKMDPLRRMQIAQGKWLPLLMDPYMNPIEVRRAMVEDGYGEKEADRFLNQAMVQQQRGMMGGSLTDGMAQPPGQPGQPQEALPPQTVSP